MRQIVVRQRQAVLEKAEAPVLSDSHPARVLVKVRYSSISPGTGGSSANRSGWSAWDCSASLSRNSAIRRITACSRPI
ncbi:MULTISPECIES: hypothetical protein [Paenibacillus]|uniref:hypothetical protein n=1 Tax=Paenibacillus TaxID=44249 RepID=UPI0020C1095B|nr:hypothetical protein [Paenibacillus dendritiformis]